MSDFQHPKPVHSRITASDIAECRQAAAIYEDISKAHQRMADLWQKMGDNVKYRQDSEASMRMLSMAAQWEYEANDMECAIGS